MSSVVLGIESSCDETAAAIVDGVYRVRSNVIASQHDLHQRYGGVVPEIASRAHLERALPVVRQALAEANVSWSDIDAIAVGNRPGLIGSLLVGTSIGKALAWTLDVPLIGVDHVHAHVLAGLLNDSEPMWPALGFVVSGGHTSLIMMESALEWTVVGRTIDDAVGEAYDKVGTMLGLPHPGGPAVDALATTGDPLTIAFPVANLGRESLDFSFSGLKTAVLYAAKGVPTKEVPPLDDARRRDLAASFQHAAVKALMRNLRRALDRFEPKTILLGGGVAANGVLRAAVQAEADARAIPLRLPAIDYCLDNGAMIALAGLLRHQHGERDDWTLVPAATSRP